MAHLEVYRGDTFTQTIRLTGPGGAALDLTGATVWFTMKADAADADTSATYKAYWIHAGASAGLTVSVATSGILTLSVPAATTTNWTPAQYQYDVQVQTALGRVVTADRGTVTVGTDVTRRTTTP